jgi:hypothetical protein
MGSRGSSGPLIVIALTDRPTTRSPLGKNASEFLQPTTQPTKCDVLYDLRCVFSRVSFVLL